MRKIISAVSMMVLSSCTKVDTQTQVLARNVIVEQGTNGSALTAADAQEALEELHLDLASVMVGTWNIVNKNLEAGGSDGGTLHSATGLVRIEADGGFALQTGSFAAIGEGSGGFCDHTAGSEAWEHLTPKLIVFRHMNQTAENSAIPAVVDLTRNAITFLGSGGCGGQGLQRVSILTRVDAGSP